MLSKLNSGSTFILFLILTLLVVTSCQNPSETPMDSFQNTNKVSVDIPEGVDADVYRISVVTPDGDSTVYFENADENTVSIAVPSDAQSMVTVNAYKNGTLVFTGATLAEAGEQTVLALKQQAVTVPASPASPELVVNGQNVSVSWTAVSDAELYKVYRTLGNGSDAQFIGSTQQTALTDEAVVEDIELFYAVSAVNAAGESALSVYSSVKITGTVVVQPQSPATPENVVAVAAGTSTITVTWGAVTDASSYNVYRFLENSDIAEKVSTTDMLTYTENGLSVNTKRGFSVTAVNSAGESEQSQIAWATTGNEVPAVPQNVTATALSEKSIRITWENVDNAQSYLVEWGLSQTGSFTEETTESVEFVLDNLEASTEYYCRVSAINDVGSSTASGFVSATTTEPPLQAPEAPELSAETVSASSVEIKWSNVADAESYIIEMATAASGPFTPACTTSGTSCAVSDLDAQTTYYFRGTAVNSAGSSDVSAVVSAETEKELLPPTQVAASDITATSVTLSWVTDDGTLSFKVYRSTSENGMYTSVADTEEKSFTDESLTSATTYYYKVASVFNGAESEKSEAVQVTTDAGLPETPQDLVVTGTTSNSVSIDWTRVTDATGYNVYWSTSETGTFTSVTVTSSQYEHTGLNATTTYYYKVSAVKDGVESELSAVVSGTTAEEQTSSGKVAVISGACTGCGHCVRACSTGAITRSGTKYVIDPSLCNGDGACISACNKNAISLQ